MALPPAWDMPPKAVLCGPGLAELIQEALFDLAVSIHDGDERAERWTDYVLAVGNLHATGLDDDENEVEELAGAQADAWSALVDDLGVALYLDPADARLIAHVLDDVAGRVGIQKEAA